MCVQIPNKSTQHTYNITLYYMLYDCTGEDMTNEIISIRKSKMTKENHYSKVLFPFIESIA